MKHKINYSTNVRYELMRGPEASERIREKRLAYLPIGCLERHDAHLPMGLDVLKAHGVCCLLAQALGGVVFPPHYYAGIHMMTEEQLDHYTGEWGNIYTDKTAHDHLADLIRQIERAGVKTLVLYSGHHPTCQCDMDKKIADDFNSRDGIKIIPFSENMAMEGDHAGMSETSFMLYLDKSLVDMSALEERDYKAMGWNLDHIPEKGSVAEGERRVELVIDHITEELRKLRP